MSKAKTSDPAFGSNFPNALPQSRVRYGEHPRRPSYKEQNIRGVKAEPAASRKQRKQQSNKEGEKRIYVGHHLHVGDCTRKKTMISAYKNKTS